MLPHSRGNSSHPRGVRGLLLSVLCLTLWFVPATAHEGLPGQIQAISCQIAAGQERAELRLRRAELFRLMADWEAAEADLRVAQALGSDSVRVSLCRAQLLADQGHEADALPLLDDALRRDPRLAEGWLLRSHLREGAGRPHEAAADLARAIALLPRATPSHYLRHARLLEAAPGSSRDSALATLEAGMERLGPVPTLVLAAAELETRLQRFDAALERILLLERAFPSPEILWDRRAEVLLAAGRELEALSLYTRILESLESGTHRDTPSLATLETRARAVLATPLAEPRSRTPAPEVQP